MNMIGAKIAPRLTTLFHDGGDGCRPARPAARAGAERFVAVDAVFRGAGCAASGGGSISWPSSSTQTSSHSCRRSFCWRRRCFLVGIVSSLARFRRLSPDDDAGDDGPTEVVGEVPPVGRIEEGHVRAVAGS